jgi:hypothetical protein
MNTPEVPAEVPAEPAAPAPEAPAEPVAATPDEAPAAPAVEPVPVAARTPSSESETQQPEEAPETESAPVSLEDAARAVVIFVKAHRTVGDADLGAALADLEAALPAQES